MALLALGVLGALLAAGWLISAHADVGRAALVIRVIAMTAVSVLLLLSAALAVVLARRAVRSSRARGRAFAGAGVMALVAVILGGTMWSARDDVAGPYLDAIEGPRVAHDARFTGMSTYERRTTRLGTHRLPAYRFETDDGEVVLKVNGRTRREHGPQLEAFDGQDLVYYPRTGIWVPTGR